MEELKQEEGGETALVETPGKVPQNKRFGKGAGKRWLVLGVLVLAVGGGLLALKHLGSQKAAAAVTYQESAVARQSVTNSLSGSGTLQPADSYTVTTLVSGEILADTFEEGDLVEEGQLLYTLDSSDASTSQNQAQNSYTQAQSSYTQAVKSKYPTADMTGTVKEVFVNDGDSVSAGTEILRIVGDDNLTVDFLFTYADNGAFYVGQSATVFINGFAGTVVGTVTAVSKSTTVSSTGKELTTVRVKAANPGLVTEDYTASGVVGSYSSYGSAAIRLAQSSTITAGASGKISGLNLLAGDSVTNGQRICTIAGDSVDNQIENAQIGLNNAKTSVQNAQDKLDDYRVTAPISGTVITKTAKSGDKIEGGSTGTLCTIYDMSYLEMTMNIDELDISKVAVGQSVQITADAVEGTTYEGVITKVSVAGTTSGGTTTYPVTVRIDETEGLLPGMNVDAEIVLTSADNVLTIPNSAVNRGNTVLITSDSPSAANALDQEAPEGYVYVQVETGVSDESNIEIVSGLQEGDTVAYLRTASSGSDSVMMGGMAMSMGGGSAPSGGHGGGAPGGGRPQG